jgi:acyl-CoA thioester hydrolase
MPGPFRHSLRVRWNECDQQGIVFNANYHVYLDIALTELWRAAAGSYAALMERGVDFLLVDTHVRFLAGARFDDELEILMSAREPGRSSLVLDARIERGGELLTEAELTYVCVPTGELRSQPVPDDVRAALASVAGIPA